MTTFRNALLPAIDRIRGIPGRLGMRIFSVSVVVRTWSGARTGLGTKTDVTTGILVDQGGQNPRVRALTSKDVIASGGLYTTEDLKVGPFTPSFPGSAADGNAATTFDPLPSSSPTEVFFLVTGETYPTAGAWYQKISQSTDKPFSYTLVLRKTAEVA